MRRWRRRAGPRIPVPDTVPRAALAERLRAIVDLVVDEDIDSALIELEGLIDELDGRL